MEKYFLDIMFYISTSFFILLVSSFLFFFIYQLIKELFEMSSIERKIIFKDFIYMIGESILFFAVISTPFLFIAWGLS